jgi:hypothetical protein
MAANIEFCVVPVGVAVTSFLPYTCRGQSHGISVQNFKSGHAIYILKSSTGIVERDPNTQMIFSMFNTSLWYFLGLHKLA